MIAGSKAPMIFVGSGAIHAREEILELAEMIDAPVVAFRSGRGIVSNAHELGLTMAAAYKLWPKTDLMIGIGTRLELPTMTRWPYRPDGLKSVRIDIDPVEMRRFTPDVAVIADSKAGTNDLAAAAKKAGYSKTSRRRAAIREATAAAQQEIPTGTWTLDKIHSSASFAVKHMVVATFRGRFEDFDATLEVGEDGAAKLVGTVKADSIVVKDENLAAHLKSPDFFDVENYPELRYEARDVRVEGDELVVDGELTIKGNTTLPDPEMLFFDNYPLPRTFTIGLDLSF